MRERIAKVILQYPRAWLTIAGLLAAAAILYLTVHGLRFDYNLENFFPADDPRIEEYRRFTSKYEPDDNIILVGFEHPDVFSPAVLSDIDQISEELRQVPDVVEVISLLSFEGLVSTEDGIEVRRLIESTVPDTHLAIRQRNAILQDSLAVGFVVNASGTATGIFIKIDREANNYHSRRTILDHIIRILHPHSDDYNFRYSGIPFMRNTYVDALQVETVKFVILSSLVIIVVLAWMFRTVRGITMPLIVTYLGVLFTLATMMLVGSAIDVLTSTVAAIILVVGIADSVHLLAKYYDGLALGLDKRDAIREMIVRLGAATFLTSVTTAIGFGTLVTSNVVPMQRFGLFTALGVLITFVVSLFLLSAILSWTRPPRPRQIERLGRGSFHAVLVRIDRIACQRRYVTLGVTAVILALSIMGATRLRVNAFVNDDVGPQTQMYRDMVFFQENLVSPIPLELTISSGEPESFKDPVLLGQIAAVQAYLIQRPEIKRTASIADILMRVNRAMHADSSEYHKLPESREMTAQYLFLLELTGSELLTELVADDLSEVRISSMIDDIGSYQMEYFLADLDSALATHLDPSLTVAKTGTIILAANLSTYLTESLLFSLGLAFLFISLIMGLLFRNLKLVLISLIPNMIPLLVTAGIMGFIGIDIKPATAVIFSISFGIAVDDTIHYLARLRQESRQGSTLREAIRRTNLGTGKAIIFTSLILLGGFFVLVTSSFQSTTYLGILVSITIFSAVLADLFLIPALLYTLKPDLSGVQKGHPSNRITPVVQRTT